MMRFSELVGVLALNPADHIPDTPCMECLPLWSDVRGQCGHIFHSWSVPTHSHKLLSTTVILFFFQASNLRSHELDTNMNILMCHPCIYSLANQTLQSFCGIDLLPRIFYQFCSLSLSLYMLIVTKKTIVIVLIKHH